MFLKRFEFIYSLLLETGVGCLGSLAVGGDNWMRSNIFKEPNVTSVIFL